MKITDLDNGVELSGRIEFQIIDANTGKLIDEFIEHNIITDIGYRTAAEMLAGVPNSHINRIIIGENYTPPTAADTINTVSTNRLILPFTRIEYPDNFSVRFNFRVLATVGNGMNMVEFGLLTANNRLFSRLVRTQIIEKSDQFEILGGYIINLK